MSPAPRLRPAGLLAALASIVALSCGSDMIDLLPSLAGATSGGSAGEGGTRTSAGADVGGSASGDSNVFPFGAASYAGSAAGSGGNPALGGQAGTGGRCFGNGCGQDSQ